MDVLVAEHIVLSSSTSIDLLAWLSIWGGVLSFPPQSYPPWCNTSGAVHPRSIHPGAVYMEQYTWSSTPGAAQLEQHSWSSTPVAIHHVAVHLEISTPK